MTMKAALSYASHGFRLFPVRPGSKKPYVRGWQSAATMDEAQIREWWKSWPDAMVGLPTGAANDLFVVDEDVRPYCDGRMAWENLHIADRTPLVETPSGGIHRYYKFNSSAWSGTDKLELCNTASRIGPCIDTRGDGGYVVAPPSMNADGRCYQWTNGLDIASREPIPAAVLKRLNTRGSGFKALLKACQLIYEAPDGTRNDTLNEQAYGLAKRSRMSPEMIRSHLHAAAVAAGLDPGEVEATLDSALGAGQQQRAAQPPPAGRTVELADIEPWPEPVDGMQLLAEMKAAIRRYVILSDDQARAVVLWTLHTYCIGTSFISPRLFISGPTKRCGKTRLLDTVKHLVPRPLATSSISMSAMFRAIDQLQPTLLIDEVDSFLTNRETASDIIGVLNNGHERGGQVLRSVAAGNDFVLQGFRVFAPTVLCGIGRLRDTLMDRSIVIHMTRKLTTEPVAEFELEELHDLHTVARKAARWAQDNMARLAKLRPELPAALHDRARDNWRPLLRVAMAISPEVLAVSQKTAVALAAESDDLDDDDLAVLLLRDIKDVHDRMAAPGEHVATATLIGDLAQIVDAPWGDWKGQGRAISGRMIRQLLKRFPRIRPVYYGHSNTRGYKWADFKQEWEHFA
ncbi:bifunctional DNA primase/polymerase [Sinorhizobium medicae]|uniref:bifunctional DNA primase/polymerase n=1 Tax=Sinorhizobium medicae TaxID=110321 RepID=UPI000FD846CA|nr:bifunctional DNA primase/polymerase [Sinorhizobium medicae]RVJ23443.1 DUF3631 domain-containing protein [Sinorhizobium medicae]